MIKIINKEKYDNIIINYENLKKQITFYKNENETINDNFKEIATRLSEKVEECEELKKEKTTLKSKITKLENQIKKMQEEEKKDKKLVKETLKEVHKEHKKRVTKKESENK